MIIIENDYYVYERMRLDNNTCFYVGKGRGRRCKVKARNEHHNRVAEKYGYETIIIKSNLTEKEALALESEIIHHYVFDLGYGIDIDGYRKNGSDMYLTNQTFGGEGARGVKHTDSWKTEHSKKMTGSGNPMYGVNMFANLPIKKQEALREIWSKKFTGEGNPMYGVSPQERMTPERYEAWLNKMKSRDFYGKNNPNYGNKTLHNKLVDNPNLRTQYYSRPKEQNGRSREVYVYNNEKMLINHFNYIGACSEWFKDFLGIKTSPTYIRQAIITSITNNKKYYGYTFSYTPI